MVFYTADNYANGRHSYTEVLFSELNAAYESFNILDLEDWLEGIKLVNYEVENYFGI